ncbi:Ppx/GppA family phosphatase [Paraurantiacibacter namhicola]|uniref:Guanosine-5'-triphosphate,3'-diphosphate pyrophosphatase n=1 Tax=Paraurantiacibacter namhicola TaxID=645517 RepID=A0A1C7DBD7_9SPHN|nr:Ppx/GppA family phosphatase [Paraurantiacibacter namhicola]ANU08765.1 Guanosine-5'-triphosphate,3'-diphosphate pyrophosphatase [Paraurantiacibacter namhicola]
MTNRSGSRTDRFDDRPDRAVIDIGSNTVRMVLFTGSQRCPEQWLNEKVSARLGSELSETGCMPEDRMDMAIAELRRYVRLLDDLGISDVTTVATAAPREAENGEDFLDRVRELGLAPRVLTGEEEGRASAHGVLSAFPHASGVVADLGGGSLELVRVDDGEVGEAVSLPLGTLRLARLRESEAGLKASVDAMLAEAGYSGEENRTLYLVGGTWRAMAHFALKTFRFPLTDPHGVALPAKEAMVLAKKVSRMDSGELASLSAITSTRAEAMPDAAILLRRLLKAIGPNKLVFSSWGLREGLLYERLGRADMVQDPLVSSADRYSARRGVGASKAVLIAAWTADAVGHFAKIPGGERLRLAAAMLALATARLEPNLRARHAYDWAIDKRWIGLDPSGRAQLAAALLAACGETSWPEQLDALASQEDLKEAAAWGLAIRLCRKVGAGTRQSLLGTKLVCEPDIVRLRFDPALAMLATPQIEGELKALAKWLGRDWEMTTSAE